MNHIEQIQGLKTTRSSKEAVYIQFLIRKFLKRAKLGNNEARELISWKERIENILKKEILKSKLRNTKFLIYKSLIRPVLTYAFENWTITKLEENQMASFKRKYFEV
ncbi:UNVERIFIED_CONTAM: hypothetical protein NCL1_28375 [Trichonephila clavipes]